MSEIEMKKIVSANLARYMNRKGITQAQIAEYLKVSESSVSYWCQGKALPRMDKIDKMCELFQCKRSDLMTMPSDTNPKEALLQAAFDDPDRRILFSLSEKATDQQVKVAIQFMKTLLGEDSTY